MYADILLTLILLHLTAILFVLGKALRVLTEFSPHSLITHAAREVVHTATSKYTVKRIENHMLPFVAKVVVVKVASYFLIRYIGKKLR